MSETAPVVPVADAPAEPPLGFGATLSGLYFEPTETFRAIARRPRWVVPFLALIAMNLAFTFVWLRKADPVKLSRAQMEEAGVFDRVPADQHDAIVQRQARLLPIFAWLGPVLFAPMLFALLAVVFMFLFRFFYASETTFTQSLAVVSWSLFAVAVISTPLTLLILALRGEWSVDPRNVVKANPAALFAKGAISKPLRAMLDSLDLFSAWTLFLLSAGYAAAARRSVGSAALGVLILWAVYVAMKVGLSFVF